jgi:hypothetical protein
MMKIDKEPLRIRPVLEAADEVVGEPHDDHLTARVMPPPPVHPQIQNVVQVHVSHQRRNRRSLWCALLPRFVTSLVLFLLAGHDTTSTTLTYALWALGHRPELQERVAAEVGQFGDRPLTPEAERTYHGSRGRAWVEASG